MFTEPIRLLAVDDDVASAELIVRVAERCGFEGFATSDSRGVMNLTNALNPKVMAVDICMPNIDANELFEMLSKANYSGKIIVVSGQAPAVLHSTRLHAESLGLAVLAVLQKPFDFQTLRQVLSPANLSQAA